MPNLPRRALLAGAPALLAPVLLTGCTIDSSAYPFPPLRHATVDLPRFMGRWYIIGHIPYFLEAGYVGSYAVYSPHPSGGIADQYNGYPKRFGTKLFQFTNIDYVQPDSGNARWRVTSLDGAIGVPYVIMHVEPDYGAFMAGYPDRSLGWVFAREKRLDPVIYRSMLERFYRQGYDAKQFRRVAQFPAQIGRPGFETV